MNILQVQGLSKTYPGFTLREVSFCVEQGTIMGFIGRNGAGKSTTLKAIMNMIQARGSVTFSGMDMRENEKTVKQRIGYAGGAVDYYKRKKIKKLLEVTRRFYENWDNDLCGKYMRLFGLDENKTPAQLSEGMKVKLNLVIALSHGAQLLILDEPTSGLDPVSRAELLEIFVHLKKQGIAILFSTHITSDLERCADAITYIRDGCIVYTGSIPGFTGGRLLEEVMISHEREALNEKFAL